MSILVKHSGVWKEANTTYVKHSGVWKDPKMIYVKHLGVWKEVGGPRPLSVGDPFEGGYVASIDEISNYYEILIIAAKSAQRATLRWKETNTTTTLATSTTDGWANTNAMNNTDHPAAKYCRDYQGGGFNDWYLPASLELYQIWLNLPPNGEATPALFKTGGAQSMSPQRYWSSTQHATNYSYALGRSFDTGSSASDYKTTYLYVRPVRKVIIYDLYL